MRDGPAPRWMLHFLPAAALIGLVLTIIVLAGCATIADCDTGIKDRQLVAECFWE